MMDTDQIRVHIEHAYEHVAHARQAYRIGDISEAYKHLQEARIDSRYACKLISLELGA